LPRKILIVEDNQDLARLLELHLRDLHYDVDLTFDGDAGWTQIQANSYDLIILDLMLPGIDGLEICRRLRVQPAYTPILMLTSKASEVDRVLGLEIGADDYVTKPFSPRELSARVRALIRRAGKSQQDPEYYRASDITLDRKGHLVEVAGIPVDLTPSEFELLAMLISTPGRTYSRSELLESLGESTYLEGYERTVDVHIHNLREKIEPDPSHPIYIQTVYGTGYRFARERM
jgi:DNA-binding response OmpR family regulator